MLYHNPLSPELIAAVQQRIDTMEVRGTEDVRAPAEMVRTALQALVKEVTVMEPYVRPAKAALKLAEEPAMVETFQQIPRLEETLKHLAKGTPDEISRPGKVLRKKKIDFRGDRFYAQYLTPDAKASQKPGKVASAFGTQALPITRALLNGYFTAITRELSGFFSNPKDAETEIKKIVDFVSDPSRLQMKPAQIRQAVSQFLTALEFNETNEKAAAQFLDKMVNTLVNVHSIMPPTFTNHEKAEAAFDKIVISAMQDDVYLSMAIDQTTTLKNETSEKVFLLGNCVSYAAMSHLEKGPNRGKLYQNQQQWR